MDEHFPDGIDTMPPGTDLGALLETWLPRQAMLPSAQAVALKRASWRQRNHVVALDEASMHEIACRRTGQAPHHATAPTRAGIAEIAQLHGWSEGAAKGRLGKIHDTIARLPMLHRAQLSGEMDAEIAGAYAGATADLPSPLDRHVVEQVMADPVALTKDAVADECLRVAIDADPELMAQLLDKALGRAHVTGGRQRNGSAYISGRNMAVDAAADIFNNAAWWAEQAIADGDPRSHGHLMTLALTGFGSGAWRMLTDEQVLAALRASRPTPDEAPGETPGEQPPGDGPDGGGPEPAPGQAHTPNGHGIDLQVELSTLLGHDRHPAALGRWGTVDAALARTLADRHSTGRWTFVLVDDAGYFLTAGLIRARPTDWAPRRRPDRAHLDLLVPISLLGDLIATGVADPAWAAVIAEIDSGSRAALARPAPAATRRFATAAQRRAVFTRSPVCAWRLCRRPSRTTEVDHAEEHCRGGPTAEDNLNPYCPPHHALKSRFGWDSVITGPMTYDLASHLGTVHKVVLPPTLRPHGAQQHASALPTQQVSSAGGKPVTHTLSRRRMIRDESRARAEELL